MNNLDAYVFDQDGTLYPVTSPLGKALSTNTRNWLLSQLPEGTSFDAVRHRFPNFTDALVHFGLSLSDWHESVCDPLSLEVGDLLQSDPRLIEFLDALSGSSYVVTLSSERFSQALLQALGVASRFSHVFNLREPVKGPTYEGILQSRSSLPDRIGVFGDNRKVDLAPAERLGMKAFYVDPSFPITDQYHVNRT